MSEFCDSVHAELTIVR